MDMSHTPALRHDGWTPARKVQFLEALAQEGNVSAACARAGLSREAAYRLRRRDPLVARAWAAALVQASDNVAEIVGTRAIEGIEEEVWHCGEVRGTRRRYDTRLLLAHQARLDRVAEDARACEDAARFDELVACIAEEEAPEALMHDGDALPLCREAALRMFADLAVDDVPGDDDFDEAYSRGRAEGAALWDGWFAGACGTVDRLLTDPLTVETKPVACTLSTSSTSALATALLARNPAHLQSGSAKT